VHLLEPAVSLNPRWSRHGTLIDWVLTLIATRVEGAWD
jgi:hypothetical protein